jgi:hypothetical protein
VVVSVSEGDYARAVSRFRSRTVVLALSLAVAVTLPAGCGGSSSTTSPGPSSSSGIDPNHCGADDAQQIADNLEAAGYKTHLSTFEAGKRIAADGTLVNVLQAATELGLPKSGGYATVAQVWVFCDPGAPERQAKILTPSAQAKQLGGLKALTQVEGPTLYDLEVVSHINISTGEAKPIPDLAPALAKLVSAGSG